MHRLGLLVLVAGMLLLLSGLGLGGAPAALATTQAPLPDRPTLTPMPTLTATTAPAEIAEPSDRRDRSSRPGRITGTVIDLSTGAPAAGVPVAVGDVMLATDSNGNYDRGGLLAASYVVELRLPAGRGEPAQAPMTLAVAEGATVVQHLAFRSPFAQEILPAATVIPEPPGPAAGPAPTAAPATLPRTGGAANQALLTLGLLLVVTGAALSLAARRG